MFAAIRALLVSAVYTHLEDCEVWKVEVHDVFLILYKLAAEEASEEKCVHSQGHNLQMGNASCSWNRLISDSAESLR
jgi:hypothetical protein